MFCRQTQSVYCCSWLSSRRNLCKLPLAYLLCLLYLLCTVTFESAVLCQDQTQSISDSLCMPVYMSISADNFGLLQPVRGIIGSSCFYASLLIFKNIIFFSFLLYLHCSKCLQKNRSLCKKYFAKLLIFLIRFHNLLCRPAYMPLP